MKYSTFSPNLLFHRISTHEPDVSFPFVLPSSEQQRMSTKTVLLRALKNKNMYVVVIFLFLVFGGTQFAINLYKVSLIFMYSL